TLDFYLETLCEEVKPVLEPVTFMMTKGQSFSVKYCQKFQSRIEKITNQKFLVGKFEFYVNFINNVE
ncbi:hypothetical protein ACO1JD_12490, partial [Staphylococcus aureus]